MLIETPVGLARRFSELADADQFVGRADGPVAEAQEGNIIPPDLLQNPSSRTPHGALVCVSHIDTRHFGLFQWKWVILWDVWMVAKVVHFPSYIETSRGGFLYEVNFSI